MTEYTVITFEEAESYMDEPDVIPAEVFVGALNERLAGKPATAPQRHRPNLQPTATATATGSFLVTVYCLSDNVPVGLFDSREDAEEFAHRVARDPQHYIERFRRLTEVDPVFFKESCLLSVDVTGFAGNVPVARSVVVNLDRGPGEYPDAANFG